ncbi:unnamed protein product [Closterium sp. NIES-53]
MFRQTQARPAVARSSTTLPCSTILPGFLTGLYIPSFSPNLVGVGYLQDHGITITFPAHGRTAICTAASTGALLATFNREPHSGLFVLHTASHQVAESGQVTASPQVAESGQVTPSPLVAVSSQVAKSGLVAASCSFRFLAHPTVLWHHRLGHPSIPRLRSMASHCLVSGLPHVFASLLRGSATFWWSSTSTPGISQPWTLSKSPQQNGVAERCIGLVMDIARTSMIHARAPHFLWPYAVRYAAHRLNLQPHVSRPEASPTSLWTGSPGIESAFCVLGCLALVHETSVDKLSARAIPCVFLGFLVDSPDYAFYHPPLHQFLDSRDVRFDETVSYYARYLCRGLLVPAPPFFLAPSPPPAPAPSVSPPPLGPALSGVSHATPLPSVARQVASPSPQSSSHSPQQPSALPRQVPVNSGGVGAGGAATGGTHSGGALLRGDGVGGAGTGGASLGGAGAGGAGARGASFGGVGAGGAGAGGANFGGAGAGGAGAGGASSGGAGAGGTGKGGASSEETGAGGTTTVPPHRHDTCLQAARRHERAAAAAVAEFAAAATFAAAVPTSEWPSGSWSSLRSSCPLISPPPVLPHDWNTHCPPRARPSSRFDDLRTVLFRSSPRRAPLVSVLPLPPASTLTVSSHPITDYYHASRLVVSRVLASLVTNPHASPSSVLALTAAVANFVSIRRLDFATRIVAAPPARPLST